MLGVEALGADGITIRVTVKVQPGAPVGTATGAARGAQGGARRAGIDIPFPQRTIWVRRDDEAGATDNAGDDPFDASP